MKIVALLVALAVCSPASAAGLLGDADRDGVVTMADAIAVAEVVVGLERRGSIHPRRADVNHDKAITMVDALLIAKHVVFGDPFQ